MTLEVGVLGPIEARREGEELTLGGPQQRRLLGVLVAAAGQVVPVDRLVEAVWPDDPPDGARRSVLTYVSRLRLALGDGSLVTQDPGYRLAVAGDGVDAARFEGLVTQSRAVPPTHALTLLDAALALWRGRAYGEFAEEWWALPHATRLDELRIAAAEQRTDALLAVGEVDRAVAELEGLVAEQPLREGPVTRLMTAHAAGGRQAEALRAADAFRKRLAEETGLDPSGELGALEASILAERPGGAGPTRSMRGYALGAAIGEGAFGTVYRSTQPGIGREVAVKVIRAELADDPGFVRRFEAEAQLVAHLEHPHIVPLYDFWREPGGAYLVFRLLRGGTAADLVERDGPLELERVDRLVTEIGSALATAHAAGTIHRDVKPSNVLFDEAGNAYLTDFGVAAAVGDDAEPWPDGTGSSDSPRYAAPEQLQGSGTTPRVDLYGLATMVWELLVGRPPFDGPTVSAILQAKLEGPVPELGRSHPDLPAAVGIVLRRATATPPEDRYADVPAFLDAWHRACRMPVASPRPREGGLVTNPYKGLRAFGESDARDYRGRETLIAGLDDAVRDCRFVAVVGPSGSGKSSLVLAGLVPSLRAAGMRVVSMIPGDSPVVNLCTALLAVAVEPPAADGVEVMLRSVGGQPGGPLVLLVDQLEELWTLTADAERDAFVAGLAALAADVGNDIRIVATLRADFFDRPLAHPTLGPLVGTSVFAITPMTEAELHDAVVEPAAARGVAFESGLDRAIVAEVANQPASLPLLQFTLAELFERRRGRVVTWDAYQAMGGLAGAIASRAEAVWSTLDDVERDACRRLLCRLVVPGEGTEDTRRRLRYSELPPGTPAVAAVLEAGRLLV
ncbi:MAG: BTAD domain-containing putative transcriptional regulator, partial [Acidimicrobiales bacterium]